MSASTKSTVPRLIATDAELRPLVAAARRDGKTIGLVPTMGALHAGHASLVDACARECGFTVVTVFVNPTQFSPGEDFTRYPRNLEADLALLAGHGADVAFAPTTEMMYPAGHAAFVDVGGPALPLEGQFRPGHFRGVATIVLKLFNLVQPDRAYFGRKDYQQSLVVRRMVEDFDLPIHVEICPIVREVDGLAMSSRNVYLSPQERQRALAISQSLQVAKRMAAQGTTDARTILARMHELLRDAELTIDYVALADPDTLELVEIVDRPVVAVIAARVGTTRLIDNEQIG